MTPEPTDAEEFFRNLPDNELYDMRELFRDEPRTEFEAVRAAILREVARRRFAGN